MFSVLNNIATEMWRRYGKVHETNAQDQWRITEQTTPVLPFQVKKENIFLTLNVSCPPRPSSPLKVLDNFHIS